MKNTLRILPLIISGMLLIHAIYDFIRFDMSFESFANYSYVWPSLMPEFWALPYGSYFPTYVLHILTLAIFVLGILNFFIALSFNQRSYRIISVTMLAIFVFRPIVWVVLTLYASDEAMKLPGLGFGHFILPAMQQLLIGFPVKFIPGSPLSDYPFDNVVGSYFNGLVVFLLLIATVILALKYKFDPATELANRALRESRVQAENQARKVHYQAQVSALQTQQQMQAQFYQNQIGAQHVNSTAASVSEEIASLQRLFESGALTEEEFTAAKKRVIG